MGKFFYLHRSKTDTRRPGQWDFPGGEVEKGESAVSAAVREVLDESRIGVDENILQLFWADADTVTAEADGSPLNVVWLFYRANVQSIEPKLSYEHDFSQWMQPAEALKAVTYRRHVDMLSYGLKYKLLVP